MTFDEMFAQAKALLENASAKDTDTAVSVQFDAVSYTHLTLPTT